MHRMIEAAASSLEECTTLDIPVLVRKVSLLISFPDLPDEMVVKIFALLPKHDILPSISLVRLRWYKLAKDLAMRNAINVNETKPVHDIHDSIVMAPKLIYSTAEYRNDVDTILARLAKQWKK
ncbi:hypothetical protein ILUMI_14466 [Ignelater luminosus]|uniref:F-box domain-containing protein n=1 Tax=Ignelater luminosus TaxID=2038154 RepID=A0A8K0CUR1_IGNLU|nr:hypothetical protein ILUMI_14466 [Ignelater luminosus]